ncbi:MAG: ribosome-associated translation inhibitor RaiA [Elusimicrobiota bacterium]|jgi:putative sigma-54 modulation protein|nr:ribosome-associated translation inhibitor RaiA [Elusimicrobiota bacterium]
MKLRITAKNIRLTEAIKEFTQGKVDKLDKFFEDGRAEVVLTVDRKIYQRAEITIHVRGKKFTAKAVEGDLYKAIDGAILKIEAQVRKNKGKNVANKKVAREDIAAFYGAPALTLAPENDVKFSVIKQVEVLPMNPEDAAYEMERLGYTFWMFLDEGSKQINLIFKRLDGTYGLIQPVKAK